MNFIPLFFKNLFSQPIPFAALLLMLCSGSTQAQTSHSNLLSLSPDNISTPSFIWTNISTTINYVPPFSITSGQPWDNTVGSYSSSGDLVLSVEAGRQRSDAPADWFVSALGGGSATSYANLGGSLPNQLNFAFTGLLSIDGTPYQVSIGQGSDGAGANNWWIGGIGFTWFGPKAAGALETDDQNYAIAGHADALFMVAPTNDLTSPGAVNNLVLGSNSTPASTNFFSGSTAFSSTVVGSTSDSASNSLTVSGVGAQLSNSGNLTIGFSGTSNSMVISNGASVINSNGYIGFNTNSVGNSVLVTGSNSSWSNTGSYLSVGAGGSSNSLIVSNGGSVSVQNLYLGYNKTSSNNTVILTDSNSSLNASGDIAIGAYGSYNSLVISNGATITSGVYGDYGSGVGGAHGSNNSVIITGSGSRWSATDPNSQFVVGYSNSSSANTMLLSNGGTLSTVTAALGAEGSSNNSVLITGSGSLWTNSGTIVIGGNIDGVMHTNDSGNGGNATVTIATGGSLISSNVIIAGGSNTVGTLNIGTLGGSDSHVTFKTAALSFGSGTGSLNFNQSDTFTLSNSVTGNGSVNLLGGAQTILTASNSYSGSTLVTNESLLTLTKGGVIGSGGVSVATLAGLQNNGVIGGSTTIDGYLRGNGGSFNNLTLAGGSFLDWNISSFTGSAGTNWDLLSATNLDLSSITSSNKWHVTLLGNSGLGNGSSSYHFDFLNVTGNLAGFDANNIQINTDGLMLDAALQGGSWSVVTNTLNGSTELSLTYAVPEPSTYALLGMGLGALALLIAARRRFFRAGA